MNFEKVIFCYGNLYIFSYGIFHLIETFDTLLIRTHFSHRWCRMTNVFFYSKHYAYATRRNIVFSSIIFRNWKCIMHHSCTLKIKKTILTSSIFDLSYSAWLCKHFFRSKFDYKNVYMFQMVQGKKYSSPINTQFMLGAFYPGGEKYPWAFFSRPRMLWDWNAILNKV